MNKRLHFFETEPIIAAVKTEEQLMRALTSECNIIFFLFEIYATFRSWWKA